MSRRVWITGVGAVTAAGPKARHLLAALRRGESHVRTEQAGLRAGTLHAEDVEAPRKILDRSGGMFLRAAEEAWSDAELGGAWIDPRRCAVIEGSSLGPLADVLTTQAESKRTSRRGSLLLRFMPGSGGAAFAQQKATRGTLLHLSAGSVSAACAIGEAFRRVAAGMDDLAVAGGSECPFQEDIVEVFRSAGILAPAETGCLPFDAARCGTVLGEGAGVLVLEAEEHARRRGARPRAVFEDFTLTRETHSLIAPDPSGAGVAEVVGEVVREHGAPGWIQCHATGTRLNDASECAGLAAALGIALGEVELVALKSTIGHCLGASGAVEAVAAVLALEDGLIPATLGTQRVDPDLPFCRVSLEPHASDARSVLLLSESFAGRCAATWISRA